MDNTVSTTNNFIKNFSSPILLIIGIIVSIIGINYHNKLYINYFFPELKESQDKTVFIKRNLQNKVSKYLIKGMLPMSNSEILFNTVNNKSPRYTGVPHSVNMDGGAQYSYSFWLNKKPSSEYGDRIILMRGIMPDSVTNSRNIIIKSPLIKFDSDGNKLQIEFNTSKNKNNVYTLKADVFKMIDTSDWYLVTVVFKDYIDERTNFERGVNVLVYLNGSLVDSGMVIKNDSLKINDGPLYILPKTQKNHYNLRGNLADIKYHNYALTQHDIEKIYKEGPTLGQFKTAIDLQNSNKFKDTAQMRDLRMLNKIHQLEAKE